MRNCVGEPFQFCILALQFIDERFALAEDPLGALLNDEFTRTCGPGLGGREDNGQICPGSTAGLCKLACSEDLGTNGWSKCKGLLTDNTVFDEVITVYLEPAE